MKKKNIASNTQKLVYQKLLHISHQVRQLGPLSHYLKRKLPSNTSFWLLLFINVCEFEMIRMNMVNGDSLNITSPNYPYYYQNNLDCTWIFSAKEETGSFSIHFLTFDLQPKYDKLFIGRGDISSLEERLHTFSSLLPSNFVVIIEETAIWIKFTSDFTRASGGFQLQIERVREAGMF